VARDTRAGSIGDFTESPLYQILVNAARSWEHADGRIESLDHVRQVGCVETLRIGSIELQCQTYSPRLRYEHAVIDEGARLDFAVRRLRLAITAFLVAHLIACQSRFAASYKVAKRRDAMSIRGNCGS